MYQRGNNAGSSKRENMKKYEELTDTEIEKYQSMIDLPNDDYPHYEPLIKCGIVVHNNQDINPMEGEQFLKSDYLKNDNAKELLISNYGRVIYDNEVLKPFIVGTFFHCLKIYIKNIDEFYIHRIVKETFDPIEDMKTLHVHHINNNALNNCPDNLLWVTETDHKKIHENSYELQYRGRKIYEKNKNELIDIFNKNKGKEIYGKELIDIFSNVFCDVIKNNTYALVKENLILDITGKNDTIFKNRVFKQKE